MRIMSNAPMWHIGHLGLIVVAGVLAGTLLAHYATGGATLRITPPEPETRILGSNPDALYADQHPLPADYEQPVVLNCKGCGPRLFERWAIENQRRIDRLMSDGYDARNDYGYDTYGNVYYDDGAYDALAGGLREAGSREPESPSTIDVAAQPDAARIDATHVTPAPAVTLAPAEIRVLDAPQSAPETD